MLQQYVSLFNIFFRFNVIKAILNKNLIMLSLILIRKDFTIN